MLPAAYQSRREISGFPFRLTPTTVAPGPAASNPGAAPFRQHSLHISFGQPLAGAEGSAERFSEGVCGAPNAPRRRVSSKLSCVQSGFSTRAHAQRKDHANRPAKMNSRNPPNIATGLTHRQPDFRASHCRGRSKRGKGGASEDATKSLAHHSAFPERTRASLPPGKRLGLLK
jgi:hypothetical protein